MDDLIEDVLQFLFDVRLEGMAVACAVHRGWTPVVTRVALHRFCRASYDPALLRRLCLQEPHQARVQRIVGIAQSAGDDLLMDMIEFRKLVVIQLTLQQWRANRSYPHSVRLHEIITLLVQSVRAELTVHHPFVRKLCFEELGLSEAELEYDVGNVIATLQRAWRENLVHILNIKSVIAVIIWEHSLAGAMGAAMGLLRSG